jgi:hypothetical protein
LGGVRAGRRRWFADGFVRGGGFRGELFSGSGVFAGGGLLAGGWGGLDDRLDLDGETALLLDHDHRAGTVIRLDDSLGKLAIGSAGGVAELGHGGEIRNYEGWIIKFQK